MKTELTSALGLLERIEARQYYKQVFRLLPNVQMDGANIEPKHIAAAFLDSKARYIAEREIESRSGLPIGSVLIHCPKSDGPKKLSNILITARTNGEQQQSEPLYKIGQLLSPMFKRHQAAIEALQEMYASMWRLIVSVSPKYTKKYPEITNAAGEVLREILTEGGTIASAAKNDPFMTNEVEASLKRGSSSNTTTVLIQKPNGGEQEMEEGRFEKLDQIEKILSPRARIEGRPLEAILDEILAKLTVGEDSTDSTETVERRTEVPETLLNALQLIRPLIIKDDWAEVEEFARAEDAVALKNPTKAEALRKFLSQNRQFMPNERVEQNRARGKDVVKGIREKLARL